MRPTTRRLHYTLHSSVCPSGAIINSTSSSAVTERPHDASCLLVVSFNSTKYQAQSFIFSYIGYRFITVCNCAIRVLYDNSVSCVRTGGTHSSWFKIEAGVRQGCMLGMGWLLDRTVESCSIGVAFGQSSFTDLDFADDVSLLAELLELLVTILETIASEAASLRFEVNCQKTKVQALGCREDMPLTIKV